MMQLISTAWLLQLLAPPMTSANIMLHYGNEDLSDSFLSKEKRIIGGQGADDGRYPYAVSLKDDRQHLCGGSLIAKDTVLTAAHCLGGYITRIVVGDDGLDVGEEIAVKFEMAHPDYYFDLDKNDIGLIFLQKPVTIDLPLLRPNDDSSLPVPGSTVYVMGWGDTDPTKSIQNMPDELMIVELEVISNADCEKAESGTDSYDGYISDDMLCTEYEGQDACQGDSGGPLIIPGYDPESDVQVGVVSWGIGCAFLPGVFSRVSTNYGWIQQTVCGSSTDPPVSLCGDVADLGQIKVQ
ncbi:hypothetical protein ACHAXH_008913 [Discostella pseudostelligera]